MKVKRAFRALGFATVICAVVWACETTVIGPDGEPTTGMALVSETDALIKATQNEVMQLRLQPSLTPQEAGRLAEMEAWLEDTSQLLTRVTTAEGEIDPGAVVREGAKMLPFPFNLGVSVVGGGVVEWLRGRKKRKGFKKLVDAINKIKRRKGNETFANALDGVGPQLREAMGEATRDEVDRVRNGGLNVIRDW